jgi:hypothetical protein
MKLKLIFIFLFCTSFCFSQIPDKENKLKFKAAFDEMLQMVKGERKINFKRAVFLAENAYLGNKLSYKDYCAEIDRIAVGLRKLIEINGNIQYKTAGNWATHIYLTQPMPLNNNERYGYNYDDFMCRKDFTSGFLTTFMRTKKGNCHSMPLFFKIVSEELGSPAYIALAPLHSYIMHPSEFGGWTNVETTNGTFPDSRDVMRIFEITPEQLKSGIYMSPLNSKESIAHCIAALFTYYQHKYKTDYLLLSMVETALVYVPNFCGLLLMKYHSYFDMIEYEYETRKPNMQLVKRYEKKYREAEKKFLDMGWIPHTEDWYKTKLDNVTALGKRLEKAGELNQKKTFKN